MEIKVCANCNIEKSLDAFYYNKSIKKYNKNCRECENALRKQREESPAFKQKKELEKENEELLKYNKKKCKECLEIKDLSEFYFRKELQRYRCECKKCLLKKQEPKKKVIKPKKEKVIKEIPSSKVCNHCNKEKSISEFRKHKNGYIFTVCTACEYKLNMERYYNKKMQDENYKKIYEAKQKQEELLKENKKICLVCFEEKDLSEFYYRADLKKHRNWCIECEKERTNKFYIENKDEILDKQHKYYYDNQELMLARKKEYANTHKEQLRVYHTKYNFDRRRNDEIYHFKSQVRHLINMSFRRQGKQKNGKTEKIVGCDFQTLHSYLLETYKINYGVEWDGIEKVHIDHIIPLATVDTVEEILELCHYTNLQLLKESDNLAKKDKLDWQLK